MGEIKNVFQKYRLCLVLSVMAVVLVAFSLLFLKEREEQLIEETPETIEVSDIYKVEYIEPGTETEVVQESVVAAEEIVATEALVVTEESVEPENMQTDSTEVEPDDVGFKTGKDEIPKHEEKPEPVPEPVTEYPAEQEPVPESVPEPESIPQEEQEILSSQEQEESCHHSWVFESFYQEPTCSNGGLENQVCANCGETQITGGTPTGEHSYRVETPGDCCSEEVVVCTECNYREIKEKDNENHIDVEDGVCYGCGETIK